VREAAHYPRPTEGVVEFAFARHELFSGTIATRPRCDYNPLIYEDFRLHLARRVGP
jgi:hypothetical protein